MSLWENLGKIEGQYAQIEVTDWKLHRIIDFLDAGRAHHYKLEFITKAGRGYIIDKDRFVEVTTYG